MLYFSLLGTTIAAPFLDVLAQRVEGLVTGRLQEEHVTAIGAVRNMGISILDELKNLAFFCWCNWPCSSWRSSPS